MTPALAFVVAVVAFVAVALLFAGLAALAWLADAAHETPEYIDRSRGTGSLDG